jgi:hypothetical protein
MEGNPSPANPLAAAGRGGKTFGTDEFETGWVNFRTVLGDLGRPFHSIPDPTVTL